MLNAREKELIEAMEPRAADEGVEIVTVEIVGAKKAPTVRVYIDADEGVGFDVLAASQAWIGDILDEIDPFPGAYTLEVSSPGIDRPLRTVEHFERFAGETVVVKTVSPVQGRSSFTGALAGAQDGNVLLDIEGERVELPIDNIRRAHVKGTVDFKS